jgi:hypothetical protein
LSTIFSYTFDKKTGMKNNNRGVLVCFFVTNVSIKSRSTCRAGHSGQGSTPEVVLGKDDLGLVLGDSLHLVGPFPSKIVTL